MSDVAVAEPAAEAPIQAFTVTLIIRRFDPEVDAEPPAAADIFGRGIGASQQDDRFFEAWLKKVGDGWNTPAGRDIIWRSRSAAVPALLGTIIADAKTPSAERLRYFRAFDAV